MPQAPYSKPFLPYPAQLALLKSRGMAFADEAKALHLLQNVSYHRFSSYWYPLLADRQQHIFKPGATFEAAFNLYRFDRELRQLLNGELEKVEVAVRTKMAYLLSVAHGTFWVDREELFTSPAAHQATLAKIREELSRSDNDTILSFQSAYSNPLPPSYMLLEVTSFGTLLRLYNNLLAGRQKKDIAAAFGLPDRVFASWLHSLVSIRNACAHHERLWNRKLRIQPLFPRKTRHLWLSDSTVCNHRLYFALSMVVYLLNVVNPRHAFRQKLKALFAKYPEVNKAAMGFPPSWHTEPLWQ